MKKTEGARTEKLDLALRYVIFGGEHLQSVNSEALVWAARGRSAAADQHVQNTSRTVHVNLRRGMREDAERVVSPIGEPIPDLVLSILDPNLEPVPPGVPGELCVRRGRHCPPDI